MRYHRPARVALCLTLAAVTTVAAQDLVQGDSGPAVRTLQRVLNVWRHQVGLAGIATDGRIGPHTATALLQLQRSRSLLQTAALDDPTLAALRDLVAPPLGTIDPIRSPAHTDLYRASGDQPLDIALHRLAPITVGNATSRPIIFESGLAVDADGAGSAWRRDPAGQAHTALRWSDGRSLDPTVTPYFVLPNGFRSLHPDVRPGDVAAVVYGRKVAYAIFGDVGPRAHLGEGSIALARALGVYTDPVHGGVGAGVFYVVFPGSGLGGPLVNDDIARRGEALFKAAGGAPPP
jgi:hypothetical protein